MSRAEVLKERFETMNNAIIDIADNCSDEDWGKIVEGENWPVGFVLQHVVAGHYSVVGLMKRAVRGQPLPDLSSQNTDAENEKMLEAARNISREEVGAMARTNGEKIATFISEIEDEQWAKMHHWSLWGYDWTLEQLFKIVFLKSGGEHVANVQATLSG